MKLDWRSSPGATRDANLANPIVQERIGPGPIANGALLAYLGLGFLSLLVQGLLIARMDVSALDAEWDLGKVQWVGRAGMALITATTTVFLAMATRRLLHSEGTGFLAAFLWAVDPMTLVEGHLFVGKPIAILLATLALMLALSSKGSLQPWAAAPLGAAAFLHPDMAWLGLPLSLLITFRGHIYAGPQHVGLSMMPLIVAGFAGFLRLGLFPIVDPNALETYLYSLVIVYQNQFAAIGNPYIHAIGLLSVLGGGLVLLTRFLQLVRINRVPGRLQIRLQEGELGKNVTRFGWIVAFAVPATALMPWIWGMTLGHGIRTIGQGQTGLRYGLSITVLIIAAFGIWRMHNAWLGSGTVEQDVLDALSFLFPRFARI